MVSFRAEYSGDRPFEEAKLSTGYICRLCFRDTERLVKLQLQLTIWRAQESSCLRTCRIQEEVPQEHHYRPRNAKSCAPVSVWNNKVKSLFLHITSPRITIDIIHAYTCKDCIVLQNSW